MEGDKISFSHNFSAFIMFPMLQTHLEILTGLLLGALLLKSEKLLLTLSQSIPVRIGFKFQNMPRFLDKLLILKLHNKIEKSRGRKTQLLYHFQCTELVSTEVISKKKYLELLQILQVIALLVLSHNML